MSHKAHDKTKMGTPSGEPAGSFTTRFFGGLWRWEAALPNGKIGEGFRGNKTDAETAAKTWLEANRGEAE